MNNDALKNERAMEVLSWLQKFSPETHTLVMERLTAMGAEMPTDTLDMYIGQVTATTAPAPATPWWETALKTVGEVAGTYLAIDAQKQMTEVNVERAKQGLAPIPTEYTAPTVRHVVDMPIEYKEEAKRLGVGMQNIFIWGGLAVAGLLGWILLSRR